jgi:hypothetical protein
MELEFFATADEARSLTRDVLSQETVRWIADGDYDGPEMPVHTNFSDAQSSVLATTRMFYVLGTFSVEPLGHVAFASNGVRKFSPRPTVGGPAFVYAMPTHSYDNGIETFGIGFLQLFARYQALDGTPMRTSQAVRDVYNSTAQLIKRSVSRTSHRGRKFWMTKAVLARLEAGARLAVHGLDD